MHALLYGVVERVKDGEEFKTFKRIGNFWEGMGAVFVWCVYGIDGWISL